MKKLFSTILVLSLLLSWNSYAGIFDLFQTSTSKCIKNLRKHTLLDRHATFENSRDVRHIHCLCEGKDAEFCDKKYYGE